MEIRSAPIEPGKGRWMGWPMLESVVQLFISGIITGSLIALTGVSWGIIYGTTHIFHFAHGLTFTFAAYMMVLFHVISKIPLALSFFLGLAAAALLGCMIERLIYRPIRRVGGVQLTVFLAAMGTMVVGEALLHVFFTPSPRPLPGFPEELIVMGPFYFTTADLGLVVSAWLSIGLLELLFARTSWGREIRAVRSNPEMATTVGIDIKKIFLLVFALGSVLMGIGAFFHTIRSAATPHMGLEPLLMAFIAVFLGGVGKNWGVALAGMLIGIGENLSLLILPAQYKTIIVFAIMFIFLIFRPQGLMGGLKKNEKLTIREE